MASGKMDADKVTAMAREEGKKSDRGDGLADFFVGVGERRAILASELSVAGAARASASTTMLELMAFEVADEQYGIGIEEIQEIIKVPEITDVPRVPEGVLGILSLRGTIVPLLDLRRVLRLEARPMGRLTRILVLKGRGDPIGLLVDRVTSVVRIDAERIEDLPITMPPELSELLIGVGRVDQEIVIILEVSSLLRLLDNAP